HHPEYRQRYAANLRRELPRIPFVGATTGHVGAGLQTRPAEQSSALPNLTTTLSSHAKSRDPVSARAQHGSREEFSQPVSSGHVRSTNASQGQGKAQTNTGSFDSAQDDRDVVAKDHGMEIAQDD